MRDPDIKLTGDLYSWSHGESTWHEVTRDELKMMLASANPPAFRTVLGKTGDLFSGPMYFDIDFSEDDGGIESAVAATSTLLDKLQALDVDLDCIRLFATGGRGFHLELPAALFGGCDHERLPQIYRQMCAEVYVEGVDFCVYSGGRGRMWRSPGVLRSNGMYKVAVTAAEVRTLDAEGYRQLCRAPREFPPLAEPKRATGLAYLFRQALEREGGKPKSRTFTAAEAELRQRFAGDAPPSARALLDGEFLPDAGWNRIAIQLGLLAHALGWDEDRLVTEAAGLIARHESDGSRYRTQRQRETELRRMFDYVDDNSAYEFSLGGLCSLLPPGHKPDLQALQADSANDAPDYWELLDAAAGDASEVVTIARQVVADQALSRTEAERLIKRASQAAGVATRVLKSDLYMPDEDRRLAIEVSRHDFTASVDSAMRVLPKVPKVRQRSGELVEMAGGRICKLDLPRLAYLMSSVAGWRYPEGFGSPDGQILQAVLSARSWPGVHELVGVALQPTLLPDGTIGAPTGFEPHYKVDAFVPYAGSGAEAMAELRALVGEFPFVTDRDEAAAIAAILTAVARPTLRTAPAFLVSAHEIGSGKTFLAELIALFAAPEVEMLRWAQRSEEVDKMLLALLSEGRPACLFDNLLRDWQSASLAAILTTDRYTDRLLGASEARQVSTRCLILATGNNVKPVKDLARRVIAIELDPGVENPLTREFKNDPVATVREDRGRWVMLALKVLQDFMRQPDKPKVSAFASFGDWSNLVRGALAHHGLPDILQAVVEAVEGDDDTAALGYLLAEWQSLFGSEPMTLRDAWREARFHEELRNILLDIAGRGDELDLQRAGIWFKANAGRVAGGLKLVQAGRNYKGAVWHVA